MHWSDERYVRLYTRDTDEWLSLSWQAQGLAPQLLRKADRSGFIEAKRFARSIANIIRWPLEVVEPAIAELLSDGMLVQVETGYLFRNFIEAQESNKSDRARAKEYREREREKKLTTTVTKGDDTVTERDDTVTGITPVTAPSRIVTPCCAVPSRTEPACDAPPLRDPLHDRAVRLAITATTLINQLGGLHYVHGSKGTLKSCTTLAQSKVTDADVTAVIKAKAHEWLSSPRMRGQFKPSVLLRPSNFATYREDIAAGNTGNGHTNGKQIKLPTADDSIAFDGVTYKASGAPS